MPRPKPTRATIEESDSEDDFNNSDSDESTRKRGQDHLDSGDEDVEPQSKKTKVQKRNAAAQLSDESENENEDKSSDIEDGEVESDGEVKGSGSSGSSSSDSEFDDGYDEKLMGDADDRKYLFSLSEVDREQIIYDRLEKRDLNKHRKRIKHKLKARRATEEKSRKVVTDSSASRRSQERRKTVETLKESKTRQAMELIKAGRSQRKAAELKAIAEKEEESASGSGSSSDGESSSSDSEPEKETKKAAPKSDSESESGSTSSSDNESKDSSSESESEEEEPRQVEKVVEFVSKKEQMERVRLSRFRMAKWCHAPFFKKAVVGCYVRIMIGPHDGRRVYRLAEISDVIEMSKAYDVYNTRTDKGLELQYAGSKRVYRLEMVSDSPMTETEFSKWKDDLVCSGGQLPTVQEIEDKVKEIKAANNYNYKDAEIDEMVQQKAKFKKTPVNFAVKKSDLIKEKEAAESEGDLERVSHLNRQLDTLEDKASELDKKRLGNLSSITYINQRNRERNIRDGEDALKREVAKMKTQTADVFTRRQCRPTMITKLKDAAQLFSEYDEPKSDDKDTKDETDAKSSNSNQSVPEVADLFQAHDFEVRIDLDVPSAVGSAAPTKSLPQPKDNAAPRRSLNLDAYKRRRGLI